MSERTVNLVVSWASLLSGALDECLSPSDETCVGGVASAAALSRFYSGADETTLVLPFLDKASPFVQMHPLGWTLNRLIFNNLMGWNVCLSSPSILTQNSVDFEISQRDISDLQTSEMPLLLTNAAVPPGNSWYKYTEAVHFDLSTGLAVMSIYSSDELMNVDQIDSAKGILNFIARTNEESGCVENTSFFFKYENITSVGTASSRCWLPVILFDDVPENLEIFLLAIALHEHPPALIVDLMGSDPNYSVPRQIGPGGVWVHSYGLDTEVYNQHVLSVSDDGLRLVNITFILEEFANMTAEAKDERYSSDIVYLRTLADEALASDPVVGTSGFMPVHRIDNYRRCMAGECELGNLFTDALRWRTGADVAFVSSGGLRGEGWPAGNVRVSNIWDALPFPNTVCTGTMTGVSLFNVFNYSTSVATFEGEVSTEGANLLQVSGMRITYNTELIGSRLVSIEVFDLENDAYLHVDRLRLYKFATDSFLCAGNYPFPDLLGNDLVFEGEEMGTIGADLHQTVVADYLGQLGGPYNTSIQGRLTNNTDAMVALNLVQNPDSCLPGSYWNEKQYSCEQCPAKAKVNFLAQRVELQGETGSSATPLGHIDLVNSELFNVSVAPKSVPSWVVLTGVSHNDTASVNAFSAGELVELQPGERITVDVCARPAVLETGTSLATVSFGVVNGGSYPGCTGQDATFDVFLRVTPTHDLNQLGSMSILGWTFSTIVLCTALFFCTWVIRNRKLRIVKTMQPVFLVAICVGVFVMGLSIIPLSIDDGIASQRGSDIACMAIPWLFCTGFTIAQSALFSKLWRINKLFNAPQMRRMQVREKDVIGPFALLFTLNFTILLVFTLVDPMQFERVTVVGEEWNSYGICTTNGPVGDTLFGLTIAVNLGAMIIACYQAYKARNVSDEFSESANLAVAMFSWVQLMIVGIPVIFLINKDNPTARYFVVASLIFASKSASVTKCCQYSYSSFTHLALQLLFC
jgi:7 transmembrane sweet-taste receptor of 3 GCPR/5'-nucleotidase, C-terminal domain